MKKPIILAVDDDPAVLGAVERDLQRHYRADYRILTAGSGAEGLETAKVLAARNTPVALFLVDQRMPGLSGIELLAEARTLHPDARRVLLTAYADTDVAIAGINEIGLDHYLMKPWDPPEERLYPVLDDLLSEWRARVRPVFDGIRILGSQFSPESFAVRQFLSANRVPYEWVDVDTDAPARALLESLGGDVSRLPVVLFPDGTHVAGAPGPELAAKAGLRTTASLPFHDVIVIGGGPAGLANAVYAASEGLRTVLVEAHAPGGQAGTTSMIENYLGFPAGVTGADLAQRAVAQAQRLGAEIVRGRKVAGLRREDPYRIVRLEDGTELAAYAVVIATGMSARRLEVPGAATLNGTGVFYGAVLSEAARYRGRDIGIVGGANSAGQAALFFSRHANRVVLLVRGRDLASSMSSYLRERIAGVANIEVRCEVEVESVHGEGTLESIRLKGPGAAERPAESLAALFIFIGTRPHADVFADILALDEGGFVQTGADLPREHGRPRGWTLEREPFMFETSLPGVFAAGDVRSGANRRVAAAVGEGSAAIFSVQRYLKTV
jgi:thioredoxin reductase (NADPH)